MSCAPIPPFRWFELEVIAEGVHIVVMVDGKITADYHDRKRLFSKGNIALQLHDPQTIVEFRKIEIKEHVPSAAAASPATRHAAGTAELAPGANNGGRPHVEKNLVPHQRAKFAVADAFQPGTIWTGKQILHTEGTPKPQEISVTLTVRERAGERFKARFVHGNSKRDVHGTIENGRIRWLARDVTVVKGNKGFDYDGTINGGQIHLTCSGIVTSSGKRRSGTTRMHLEK